MARPPVIAVFDVGKSNKKFFLFNEAYRIVHEETVALPETTDEDGFPCEDVAQLSSWVHRCIRRAARHGAFELKAINFSAYGASLVHLDAAEQVVLPLYNYLKPFPETVQDAFNEVIGNESAFMLETGAPVLGFLNSGLQLYWLKKTLPQRFAKISCCLHLPQFISFLVTGKKFSEITSLGCHTALWNLRLQDYHRWVYSEGLQKILAPLVRNTHTVPVNMEGLQVQAGPGMHDSSAALLPYLRTCKEPFVLVSTGTWNVSLSPFNNTLLNAADLENNCLCYLDERGQPVKAARLFAGYMHAQSVAAIAAHFQLQPDFHHSIPWDPGCLRPLEKRSMEKYLMDTLTGEGNIFRDGRLSSFSSVTEAYYYLMTVLVDLQTASLKSVLPGAPVKKIFVDGGFSHNPVFMHLLASSFPDLDVCAASVPQASAVGAALAVHAHWHPAGVPSGLVQFTRIHPVR